MKKKCFVIQPITTPEYLLSAYHDDKDHFNHVFEDLFAPAIEEIGLEPVSPIAKGSVMIQGDIIKNLSESELILVDMSTLNPNVFFEMGIRTALNKPTCIVIDNMTNEIPFDAKDINYYKYLSSLKTYEIKEQIINLSKHLKKSVEISKGKNSLWKYFGITTTAEPLKEETDINEKIGHLSGQIQSLRTEVTGSLGYTGGSPPRFTRTKFSKDQKSSALDQFANHIIEYFKQPIVNTDFVGMEANSDLNTVTIDYKGLLNKNEMISLRRLGDKYGIMVYFNPLDNK